ncbi:MAG: hypothetical protein QM530_10890 [Phycisphaerales bacterium]|nr:hypothetical protein [Phycisphaerales bacterium]
MKRKLNLVVLLFIALHGSAFAQKERVQFNFGNFLVPKNEKKVFEIPLLRQFGISYSHEICPKFAIRATYNMWYDWHNFSSLKPILQRAGFYDDYLSTKIGARERVFDHQMIEISGCYQNKFYKKHSIYGSIGISLTWGKYNELVSAYSEPGYLDWLLEYETKKSQHLGLVGELGYNYFICHNRINVGMSEAVRVYANLPAQLYLNLNVGYHFNWATRKK